MFKIKKVIKYKEEDICIQEFREPKMHISGLTNMQHPLRSMHPGNDNNGSWS